MSGTQESRPEKRMRALQQVASVFFLSAILAGLHLLGFTVCPTKRFLGIPCPVCGTTRAAFALLHGRILEALSYQPLMVPAVLLVGLCWSVNLVRLWSGRDAIDFIPTEGRRAAYFWNSIGILFLVNWAYVLWHGN